MRWKHCSFLFESGGKIRDQRAASEADAAPMTKRALMHIGLLGIAVSKIRRTFFFCLTRLRSITKSGNICHLTGSRRLPVFHMDPISR